MTFCRPDPTVIASVDSPLDLALVLPSEVDTMVVYLPRFTFMMSKLTAGC
jgi:hypothetical protein